MEGATTVAVAIVGVLGTLLSALLTQRAAARATRVELAHAERERAREREERERADARELRRASYVALNQLARAHHRALGTWYEARSPGARTGVEAEERAPREAAEKARDELNAAYAEAQLAVSDEVLTAVSRLVLPLFRIQEALEKRSSPGEGEDIAELMGLASRRLYEARQVMRRDLGISQLPVERPEDHGKR
ncbi:hypothetical protein [Streptomyces sedi]|uniref:Uncharacterized protein n=1 Tax=Streptomyces sedi TaxID=555059 RepID=A0A5C4V897_9ACTN|nr:hypothetical protein [Streptomyces sedi]TNM32162.1 hypothetical protein FH715_07105 [Streptomyces sedi]